MVLGVCAGGGEEREREAGRESGREMGRQRLKLYFKLASIQLARGISDRGR